MRVLQSGQVLARHRCGGGGRRRCRDWRCNRRRWRLAGRRWAQAVAQVEALGQESESQPVPVEVLPAWRLALAWAQRRAPASPPEEAVAQVPVRRLVEAAERVLVRQLAEAARLAQESVPRPAVARLARVRRLARVPARSRVRAWPREPQVPGARVERQAAVPGARRSSGSAWTVRPPPQSRLCRRFRCPVWVAYERAGCGAERRPIASR